MQISNNLIKTKKTQNTFELEIYKIDMSHDNK